MKNAILAIALMTFGNLSFGQNADWIDQMNDPSVNFYTVVQSFENYWENREVEKGKGYKQFLRWAAFMAPRVYPDGTRPDPAILAQQFQLLQQNQAQGNIGQWAPLGPLNGSTIGGTAGIGRVNRIVFDPINSQVVWAATPAGGLWKSTDGGLNWSTNTDQLTNLGVSDIAIDPSNTSIMYIATGDRDGGDTYSYGILKSTDGGQTWNPTGLSFNVPVQVRAQNLYVNPDSSDIVIAVTRVGIYRSTDAGANWTRTQAGSYNGLVQKVDNSDVLFTTSLSGSSCSIYKSTDNGVNWTQITHPSLPTSNARRIELAVTPDDPNYIYALVGASDNGFEGIYRSTNAGISWTQRASSPNLLGWSTSGSDQGGQAWYDLALAVNPSDRDEVRVGGVNTWKSTNGGANWSLASHWYGGGGAPFVHADCHHLTYQPGTNALYAGTDGGVYRDTDSQFNWDELNDGMNITQYYRMSASVTDTARMIAGAQDNGTHRLNNQSWNSIKGGDGMDCAINTKNPNVMYASSQYGNFSKSTNGGASFNATFNLPPVGNGNWITPVALDPRYPDTIYFGYDRVWRSFNGGVNFSAVSPANMSGGRNLDLLAVDPTHTNNVYAAEGNDLFKSIDFGSSWTNISSNVSGSSAISFIAVAANNSDHVIITRSGYSSNQKVYESYDGGQSWDNISQGLPNIPANCVTIENTDERSVYVGTDLGIFYRDSLNPVWVPFNAGLPNVIVNDLEINYVNRKLRAATYGRGIWESPLYGDLVPPVSKAVFPATVCVGDTVSITNISDYNPDRFKWNIEPATFTYVNGDNDSTPSPTVVFSQKGLYNISLVSENVLGRDSAYFVSAIAVGGAPLPYTTNFDAFSDYEKWQSDETVLNGWEHISDTVGEAFKVSFFNNPTLGEHYELISPAIDLSKHDSAWMSFDHAYSGKVNGRSDSLLVYIATSCSDNWLLLEAYGEDGTHNFVTAGTHNNQFVPAVGDWCGTVGFAACNTIDLSPYAGSEGVRLKFVAINANGNDLYLDNVKVTGNPTAAPIAAFNSLSQVCALDPVSFVDQSYNSPDTWQWTFTGPEVVSSNVRYPQITFSKAGTYEVKLVVANSNGTDSVVKSQYISVDPADSVWVDAIFNTNDTLCAGATYTLNLNTQNAGGSPAYQWFRNGIKVASTSTPSYEYKVVNDGDELYASLTSSLGCSFPEVAFSDTMTARVFPAINPQISIATVMCSTDPAITLTATPAGGTFSGSGVNNGIFDPGAAGIGSHEIVYSYTGPNGCVAIAKKYVGVAVPPAVAASAADVCEGDAAVALTAGSPGGGQYSGPGIFNNMFYADSVGLGTYTLSYTYTTSFCGTISKTFSLTVNPLPAAPAVLTNGTYLEASVSANSYQWYDQNGKISGETRKTFTPTVTGQYRVEIIDNNGCSALSPFEEFNIGLSEIPVDLDFRLFPNPANENINLVIQSTNRYDLVLYIHDNVGRLVKRVDVNVQGNLERSIDLSALPAGVYLFSLDGEGVQIRQKIVVQ